MKTGVNITFTNTATGVATSADGVAMLFCQAVAVVDKFVLGTKYKLTQLSDLDALGIDAAYDATNKTAVYKSVSEFYTGAGSGAVLYLVGIAKTTDYSDYVATSDFEALVRSTGVDEDGNPSPSDRARLLGFVYYTQTAAPETGYFYADVLDALTAINTKLKSLFDEGFRACAILDGNNCVPASLPDLKTKGCSRVALMVSTATPDTCASVGLALGILARNAVNYDLGNVSAGYLPISAAYFTDGETKVSNQLPAAFDQLGIKQYLFLRTRPTKSGYFFNDGATAEDSILALSNLANNRVLIKVADYAEAYLINLIGSTPQIGRDGNVSQVVLSAWESGLVATYYEPMIRDGEIADIRVTITNSGVFSSTKTVACAIEILPRVGLSWIQADTIFVTSL